MLQSDLCGYSDAYYVLKWTLTVVGEDKKDRKNKLSALKNNATFISSISKTNNVLTDKA